MYAPTAYGTAFPSRVRVRVRASRALLARALLALLCAGLALAPAAPVHANTLSVTNCLDDGSAGSLRTVLAGAVSGDTLTFAQDCIIILLIANDALIPPANVTIDGTGHNVTINGRGSVGLFRVTSGITLALTALTLANGGDYFTGGAITNNGGTVRVTNSAFSGNSAGIGGGAILNNGGTVRVTNSAFSGNYATRYGGAIYNSSGTVQVTGSTFSGNAASASGLGGAIYNNTGATLTLTLSVVAGNGASTSGPDLSGTITSGGGNVVGKTNGSTGITDGMNHDRAGTVTTPLDPRLAPLALNVPGTTQTFALLPGSPALDRAPCPTDPITMMPLATDGRGVPRPQGSACDSGSFESQGFILANPTGNNQSATATTPFAAPLTLTVGSSHGESVAGGTITFTITPGVGGASASFTGTGTGCTVSMGNTVAVCPVNTSGIATAPTLKAGLNTGSFTVTGSTAGVPVAGNVTYTLTNTSSAGLITPQPHREPNGTPATGTPASTPLPQPTRHG